MRNFARWRLQFCDLVVAVGCLSLTQLSSGVNTQTEVLWETWGSDYIDAMGAVDPGGAELLFYGVDGTGGASRAALAKTVYSGSTRGNTGDVVELGYFRQAMDLTDADSYVPVATASNLFTGLWTPLTSTTAIGDMSPSNTNDDGAFHLKTLFDSTDAATKQLARNFRDMSNEFNDDMATITGVANYLPTALAALDTADNGGDAFLAVRIYDINTASVAAPNTTAKTGGTRYNTVSAPSWKWVKTAAGTPAAVDLALHDKDTPSAAITTGLAYEFANSGYASDTDVKIGTGTNKYLNDATGVNSLDNVATITYHDGVDDALDLRTAGIGSTILSGLTGGGAITGGSDGNTLTLFSAAGNTEAANAAYNDPNNEDVAAFSFGNSSGNGATNDGSISGDVTVVKIGDGDQIIAGTLNIADTDDTASSGYLNLKAGTLILKPVSAGPTQSVEYLTGAGDLVIDNSNDADHIVELGFAETVTAQTLSGTVALSSSGVNAIKVASGTADEDYGKEQIFSGVVSGAATLEKKGVGRLNLTGSNTLTGNMNIDDGTLIVGHNNALGQAGEATTVTINKGKLEVASGITTSSDVTIQGGASRNFIGGDGTVNAVVIGSGANEVDVVSPGQGISSSFNLLNKQAPRGKATADVSADASVGSFTSTTLSLLDGGVYDWEISNFDGTGTAGTDWDLLNFDTLNLGAKSDSFAVNVYGIVPDAGGFGTSGEAGTPKDADGTKANLWKRGGSKFKFLDGGGGSTVNWTGGSQWSTSELTSYFAVNDADLAYHTNMWGGDWTVTYESNAFYLNFSAVPEPSTYVMVTGLLMLPGFQFLRRFRKRKNDGEE
jgi:autotransporter-associated beta strand protein